MIALLNKKPAAAIALALSSLLVAGCSSVPNKSDSNSNGTKVKSGTYSQPKPDTEKTSESSTPQSKNDGNNSKSINKPEKKVNSEQSISEKVKNYIINGQGNKPEAGKIKWSKSFLDRVDIEGLYKQYIANGGHTDDLESFAGYMTLNAPIPSDWKELFEKDLYDAYGEKVVRLEHLKDDLYQAYVVKDGSQVPYVVVSSRTGYFHG